ncbi:DUF6234 family protein [Streptomyces sp. NPDC006430]|uniref:DUF6234 family protein n=1 Tax=Streptomyces sp. NPDC006430 TaxID=3154299 RepID=UPI0033B2984B
MTTQMRRERTGAHWAADISTAVLTTGLEVVAVGVGLYVAIVASWDPSGTGDDRGHTALVWLLTGTGAMAVVAAVVSGFAFRGRAPVTGSVQALVCAALLVGTAGLAFAEWHGSQRPPSPAPTSTYRGTYGQCFSGGDSHECPGG